jgi:hypothetical protein
MSGSGRGTLFTEPVLVVNQKAKLIELNQRVCGLRSARQPDRLGRRGRPERAEKAVRFISSIDQFMTHRLEVRDQAGQVRLVLTRPAKIVSRG